MEVTNRPSTNDFRLNLEDGGRLDLYREAFGLFANVADSCIEEVLGTGQSCTEIEVQDGSCSSGSCGICECQFTAFELSDEGTWSRTATELSVSLLSGETGSFEYCVQGDIMELHEPSGVAFQLERLQAHGTPTPCASRSSDTCTLGTGCVAGACTGGETCTTATSEANCTNRMGCSWDPSGCSGQAPGYCELAEYDVVPGCEFVGPSARCSGTPEPCDGKVELDCATTDGCTAGPGCVGSGTISCQRLNGACAQCELITGCSCGSGAICDGSPRCEDQVDGTGCDYAEVCEWVDYVCRGTPTACEELSVADCAGVAGCSVVP
jgi:hypothetical protein